MKKAGYILLSVILMLQSGGVLLFYQVQQSIVQYEMQEVLANPQTHFQKIIIPISDFKKSKINTHEISVDGKMYDVKSINIIGNEVELHVINDTKEEGIAEQIKKEGGKNNGHHNQLPNQLIKFLSLVYLSPISDCTFLSDDFHQNIFQSICETIVSHKSDITSPPPEIV